MKRLTIFLATLCLMLTSCITEDTPHNTPEGNFDYLWKILDEHYCFFAEKNKLYGVDWNDVYARYKPQVRPNMSNEQLFTLCAQMLLRASRRTRKPDCLARHGSLLEMV